MLSVEDNVRSFAAPATCLFGASLIADEVIVFQDEHDSHFTWLLAISEELENLSLSYTNSRSAAYHNLPSRSG